eukprot:SAG31_NODE_19925_length_588_cov_0.950920_1_plen_68_part_01
MFAANTSFSTNGRWLHRPNVNSVPNLSTLLRISVAGSRARLQAAYLFFTRGLSFVVNGLPVSAVTFSI